MADRVAVVITALSLECLAIREYLTNVAVVSHPQGTVYDVGTFASSAGNWKIAIAQAGPGNVAAAIETERAVAFFEPSFVFFCGVAGGLKDLQLGDVVAATKIYEYESGKDQETFKTRPNIGESSYNLVQQSHRVVRENKWTERIKRPQAHTPKARVGPIAAGEKVVASTRSATFGFLREHYNDALAVEMEGFGVLRAGYANAQVSKLVVRGISDLIDEKNAADAKGSQEIAACHAAAFTFSLIEHLDVRLDSRSKDPFQTLNASSTEWWSSFEQVAIELYPQGANENQIWSRAGGDLSLLEGGLIGKASWHSALKKLKNGGGGDCISISSLLQQMDSDFPRHPRLASLIASHSRA